MKLTYPDYKKLVVMALHKQLPMDCYDEHDLEKLASRNSQIIHDAMAFDEEPNSCARVIAAKEL